MRTIAALYVLEDGPYAHVDNVECWGISRDARMYAGPHPVVAHPPCERWGRYWHGGPSACTRRIMGDDDGCFEAALESVRAWGGVLEHPQASHAWSWFGLTKPPYQGGWVDAGDGLGRTCCVFQGHYGHLAQKATWLYAAHLYTYPELVWGKSASRVRLDQGFHSAAERRRAVRTGTYQRLSKRGCTETPPAFRDLLLELSRTVVRS